MYKLMNLLIKTLICAVNTSNQFLNSVELANEKVELINMIKHIIEGSLAIASLHYAAHVF